MRISFFEEYPDDVRNLAPAQHLPPSTVFLAAKSATDFLRHRDALHRINPQMQAAYWPILPESYWFSPWSNTRELEKFAHDLDTLLLRNINHNPHTAPLRILLDLELPLLRPALFFRNMRHIPSSARWIRDFLQTSQERGLAVTTAEYPPIGRISAALLRALRISVGLEQQHAWNIQRCLMCYSSMIPSAWLLSKMHAYIRRQMAQIQTSPLHPHALSVGLGVLAHGVFNEPLLSVEKLQDELETLKTWGLGEVMVFRLGGISGPIPHYSAP